jgi:hypothetical protein
MYALITLVIYSGGSCNFPFNSTALHTNMTEKHKSTSPSAIQAKNWQKPIGIEEKLEIIS